MQFCAFLPLQSARSVWRQSNSSAEISAAFTVAICTERVEAKSFLLPLASGTHSLQSARSVWRQSCNLRRDVAFTIRCNLHGACGGKVRCPETQRPAQMLQSARSVWRQSVISGEHSRIILLQSARSVWRQSCKLRTIGAAGKSCNLHGACGGKGLLPMDAADGAALQSARSVWRQRNRAVGLVGLVVAVAICTERVEAKGIQPLIMDNRVVAICTERVEAKNLHSLGVILRRCCNLHGACGGKACKWFPEKPPMLLQSARSVWRQRLPPSAAVRTANPLQSARSVWRQSAMSSLLNSPLSSCNLHGACGGKA